MADEALTAGAVARRLGVAVTTLRTWHQRYGLGPSHHVPGQHRRYTPADMDRLQVMRRLTAQGVAPAEAAAWARRIPVPIDAAAPLPPPYPMSADGGARQPREGPPGRGSSRGPEPTQPASGRPESALENGSPTDSIEVSSLDWIDDDPGARGQRSGGPASSGAPAQPDHTGHDGAPPADATFSRAGERVGPRRPTVDAVWPEQSGRMFVARDGGGHAIRTGRAGPAARGLARAAMRLDGPALRDILEMTVTDRGVVAAWEEVIMPVLIGVGERYAATKRFIEVEHLLSRGITEVLGSVTRPPSSQNPRVLLAAADEEQHTLPLEALAAALAQAGVSSRLLGARVPAQAVGDALTRTGPAALVLWSQLPGSADPAQWPHVLSSRQRPLLVAAAGPGWQSDQLPDGVTPLGSLPEALRLVSAVALPADRSH